MPKYRVLKSHVHAPGGHYVWENDLIELSKEEAAHRLAIGFVEGPVIEPPAAAVAAGSGKSTTETAKK